MPLGRRVARFNRSFANYLAGPLFTRMPGFGAVHHRGRRSQRAYRTPVKVFRQGRDEYVFVLPYGPRSDWVRNVLAAGGCELTSRGQRVRLTAPTLVGSDRVRLPAFARSAMARIDASVFLVLKRVPVEGAQRADQT